MGVAVGNGVSVGIGEAVLVGRLVAVGVIVGCGAQDESRGTRNSKPDRWINVRIFLDGFTMQSALKRIMVPADSGTAPIIMDGFSFASVSNLRIAG
jgi:hypothetical protein